MAAAGPSDCDPLVINDSTKPSKRSILFCMSSGEVEAAWFAEFFFREFV
jgi:hypothetical protein